MEKEMQDLSHAIGVVERDILGQQKGNAVLPLHVRVPIPMGAAGEGVPQSPTVPLPGYEQWVAKELLQPPCSAWLIMVPLLCDFSAFLMASEITNGQHGKLWPL